MPQVVDHSRQHAGQAGEVVGVVGRQPRVVHQHVHRLQHVRRVRRVVLRACGGQMG